MDASLQGMRDTIRAQCEADGISGAIAIAHMSDGYDKVRAGFAYEWIDEYERREAAEREEAHRLLNEKAVAAAQLAAETSSTAAEASRQSAKWTMWAALVAAASTVVSVAQMLR